MADIETRWVDATSATRKSALIFSVYDVGTPRVGVEFDAISGGVDLRLIPGAVGTVKICGTGSYTGSALSVNGIIAHNDTMLLRTFGALADGAAGHTATMTNSPTAGDPTKWVPIDDNGVTRYIPAW